MKVNRVVLVILVALAFCAGPVFGQTAQKAWTVLVYMMADNDLEESGVDDLIEMTKADIKGKANVIVQVDRAAGYDDRPSANIKNFTTTKRLELAAGSFKEIADLGETDGGKVAALRDFITWGLKTYPAQKVSLILWDHGGAWPGFGVDESGAGNLLTIADMDAAISQSLTAAGRPKFDLLAFDACLMATYEVARAMRTRADIMLASTETEPGHGYDYKALSSLASEPDAVSFAKKLADGFAAQAKEQGEEAAITQSVIDLNKLAPLDRAVESLANFVKADPGRVAPVLGRSRGKTLDYGKGPRPDEDTQMVDLGNLAKNLAAADSSANATRDQILAALKSVVLYQITGRSTRESTGLSIYFPPQRRLYDSAYDRIDSGTWKSVLTQYFAGGSVNAASAVRPSAQPSPQATPKPASPAPAQSPRPSPAPQVSARPSPAPVTSTAAFAFTEKDGEGQVRLDDGFVTITGHMPRGALAKVVEGVFSYGIKEDEDYWLIGDAPVEIDDKTGTVEGNWDLSSLVLTQGRKTAYAFLSEDWKDDGIVEYTIPLNYYSTGRIQGDYQEIFLVLTVDEDGNVLSENYFREQGGQYAQLKPRRGSVVVPVLGYISDDGEVEYVETSDVGFDPNIAIEYDFEDVDNAETELLLYLEVYDAGEAGDYLSFEGFAR